MLKTKQSLLRQIWIAIIVISIALSSLVCCTQQAEIAAKEDINNNISSVMNDKNADYEYVHIYLREFGINNFDVSKMLWVELQFQSYFNLESGLPRVSEHAKATAELFLSDYYDKINLSDKNEVTDALINCYVDVIGDPYSIYRTPEEHSGYSTDMSGTFGGIGVVVNYDHDKETITVSSVYIDSPANKAGIQAGDMIVKVNDKTTEQVGYLNIVDYVRGEVGTSVTVTVKRNEELIDFVMTRDVFEEKTVSYAITEDSIAYIQIVGFKDNTYTQFVEAITEAEKTKAKGIIFDLRGNPGGYVDTVCKMLSYLIPNGHTIVSYQYRGTPIKAIESTDDANPLTNEKSDHSVNLPMVVICDGNTASAGELFTAGIRDYTELGILNGKVVGQRTYGKGIMQSSIMYRDRSSVTLTVSYYNPPCGINYHQTGITPDVTVMNEIQDGKIVDKQFDAAVSELEKLINAN